MIHCVMLRAVGHSAEEVVNALGLSRVLPRRSQPPFLGDGKQARGPFLAGGRFSAADAFFAPVALRIQTYDPPLDETARRYAARLRELPAMLQWYEAALTETWRDPEHEDEVRDVGAWTQDLRAK